MLLLLTLLMPAISLTQNPYCTLCDQGSHTMCMYPKEGPSVDCVDYIKVDLTNSEKHFIVDVHNDLRNHIASGEEDKGQLGGQPPASNMLLLEWHEELAKIAQRWADQCLSVNASKQHDTCKITSNFSHVGQNILSVISNTTRTPDLSTLILYWYKQVQDVIPTDIEHFEGTTRGQFIIGQFAQLVWAETSYIGCAMAIYREVPTRNYNKRFVCNYGPGGNIIGQSIYRQGPPCSKCVNECDRTRKNLCKSSEKSRSSPSTFSLDDADFSNNQSLCIIDEYFKERNSAACKSMFNVTADVRINENIAAYEDALKAQTITQTEKRTQDDIPNKSDVNIENISPDHTLKKMFRPPRDGEECVCLIEIT